MKFLSLLLVTMVADVCLRVSAQGFVYDQQSATSDTGGNSITATIQSNQPIGQSFIPSLSTVGFVRFFLFDAVYPNPLGATVLINLWSGSIGGGTLMASTDPVLLTPGFDGYTNFYFGDGVSVNSGTTYYFELVVQSGDTTRTGINSALPGYANGTAFFNGTASPSEDLWFREGVVVPEPSSILLSMLGLAGIYFHRRKSQ
jgi:hypothetical protein